MRTSAHRGHQDFGRCVFGDARSAEPVSDLACRRIARVHDDPDLRRLLAKPRQDVKAASDWHLPIEHRDIWLDLERHLPCLRAITRYARDLEVGRGVDDLLDRYPKRSVVIRHQHPHPPHLSRSD
jgi:hypothetical protein